MHTGDNTRNALEAPIRMEPRQTAHSRITIGLPIHSVAFVGQAILLGIVDAAHELDVNVVCVEGGELCIPSHHAQGNVLYDMIPKSIDGLIFYGAGSFNFVSHAEFTRFCHRHRPRPMVSIGGVAVKGVPNVFTNTRQGIYHVVSHLIQAHGCRRIAYVHGNHVEAPFRYQGYADALADHDIPLDPALIVGEQAELGTEGDGSIAITELIDARRLSPPNDVEAIMAASDMLAIGAISALQQRGFRVPDDVAVAGFDDHARAVVTTPPLTTAHQPFYDMGRQTVDLILRMLRGEDVPDVMEVHAPVIVRESCGCYSSSVSLAAAPESPAPAVLQDRSLQTVRADEVLAALVRALEATESVHAADWMRRIVESFLADVCANSSDIFLNTLRQIITTLGRPVKDVGHEMALLHNIITHLRQTLLPYYDADSREGECAEYLWHQARILIGEAQGRTRAQIAFEEQHYIEAIQEFGKSLSSTFDMQELREVLANGLPALGIHSCALALYENPQPYTYPQPAPECSQVLLAYDEHGQHDLTPATGRFQSRQFFPTHLLPYDRQFVLIVEALYFREQQIGFMTLEMGPRKGAAYSLLRSQISSALQGALLVERIRERTAEIERQKYILDTFMENVPDSIYFKDREGRIIRSNQALAEIFGVSDPQDLIGTTDFDFFPEDTARSKYEQEQDIIQTGRSLLNLEEPDVGGRWALTTKMPLRDEHGDIIGTFGISHDISSLKQMQTDLRRAHDEMEQRVDERTGELRQLNEYLHQEIQEHRKTELSLQVSEQQYRRLADQMAEGLVIVRERTPVFVNTAFAALVEDSSERILQNDVTTWFPLSARTFVAERLALYDTKTPVRRWHTEFLGGSDCLRWVEIEQRSIVWDNQPAQLLTVRDITEQKRRETHLEQERARLQEVNVSLKSTIGERFRFGSLVGKSPAMQQVYELIISAATSDVNALLVGESGTGKELIARTIHQVSARKSQAFVPVNCASIPESLFEREFFGHRKGAFTGADRNQIGLFDRAHNGTLFLDEVTELSPGTQAKLLRVLQDGEYLPLGGTRSKLADVLIVAATNTPYDALVRRNVLREDFFYRICVIEIQVPPLRDRKEDIPLLIEHFLNLYRHKQQQRRSIDSPGLPILPGQILETLYAYDWPGNIRELSNVLQRYLATQHLDGALPLIASPGGRKIVSEQLAGALPSNLSRAVKAFEKQIIATALEEHQHNVNQTAKSLEVPFTTLYRKAQKYQLL